MDQVHIGSGLLIIIHEYMNFSKKIINNTPSVQASRFSAMTYDKQVNYQAPSASFVLLTI